MACSIGDDFSGAKELSYQPHWFCLAGLSHGQAIAPLQLESGVEGYRFTEYIEYFRDRDNRHTFHTITELGEALDWQVHQGSTPNFGCTTDTVWLKRTISARTLPQ